MLLSRFWIVLLSLALGASAFTLFVADQMYNHQGSRAMSEALAADSSAVGWYLRDDSRQRSSALIKLVLSSDLRDGLAKASGDAKIDRDTRAKVKATLSKLASEVDPDLKFDAVWAVDANGRIVANVGFDHAEDWELGGYSSVADAIHGWIRDDAWVWKGRVFRVVTRPVEREAQGEPVGAVVGAKIVDDNFARAVSKRTGAAVGFYADGARIASGAPEGFDKAYLDEITSDLKTLESDKDYNEKGRTEARVLGQHLGVVYARLPGETWELGAGYAVGHLAVAVGSPFDFLSQADNSDKEKVPTKLIVLFVLVLVAAGLGFTFAEYNRPLATFRNDEKVAAKGGAPRRAADLEQVLGPIPAQPQMSAFSVPGGPGGPPSEPGPAPARSVPRPPVSDRDRNATAPRLRSSGNVPIPGLDDGRTSAPAAPSAPRPPPPPRRSAPEAVADAGLDAPPPPEPAAPAPAAAPAGDDFDELADWRRVFEEFVALKRQCGEETGNLTFEKFKGTLQRNKDALVARHNCSRVKFTVYVKEGKAALKASPVK